MVDIIKAHMVSEGQYGFIGLLKGLHHFYIYARLLIRIKEGLRHLGMGARRGKLSCQAADLVLESPVTQHALAT